MANPSNMAKHWVGGLPPALIQRIIGLLEMDKEAVLRQGWGRPSIEGPTIDRAPVNHQSSPRKVCHGRKTYERFEGHFMTEATRAVSLPCHWLRLRWSDIDQWSVASIPSPSKTCPSPPESTSLVVPVGIQIASCRSPSVGLLPPTTCVGLPLQESLLAPFGCLARDCALL